MGGLLEIGGNKLTTDWHGYFTETIAGFDVYFHCKGKTQTLRWSSLSMGGADYENDYQGQGQDHLGRAIYVEVQGHYILDTDLMQFVVEERCES